MYFYGCFYPYDYYSSTFSNNGINNEVFLGAAEFLRCVHPLVMRVWKERQDVQCWDPTCVCQ